MKYFIFDHYEYDSVTARADFYYGFDDGQEFVESVTFDAREAYDAELLDRALFLSWMLIGTSYYKCFPVRDVQFKTGVIDAWQASFLRTVYHEGLSQFAFENNLTRDDLAQFMPTGDVKGAIAYDGEGVLALQSGGKDSLLMAQLLEQANQSFESFYISSAAHHPAVLDEVGTQLHVAIRSVDIEHIKSAIAQGGLNGHVPVTFIVQSLGLIQAILNGQNTVVVSIGHEGAEPHAVIGDLDVNHQWSKTWEAEQLFSEYVGKYISPDIQIGSPLRSLSEFRVSQLFVEKAWSRFGHSFSSCNRANYTQGADNSHLSWCGDCPKCANAFLLFSPFVPHDELSALFGGQDLFVAPNLTETFKGLLGIDGVMKPFECIGEVDELRYAYHLSQGRGFAALPFEVPGSDFDVTKTYPAQDWAQRLIQPAL